MASPLTPPDRSRTGWWALTLAIGLAFAFVLYSFVGTFIFGVFLYYGLRPLQRRLQGFMPQSIAAVFALLVIALPMLVLVGSLAVIGIGELRTALEAAPVGEMLGSSVDLSAMPSSLGDVEGLATDASAAPLQAVLTASVGVLAFLTDVLLHVFIAVTAAFYLLRDDEKLGGWFESNVADAGSPAHAYATAVDRDLATIYFGNVLLVGAVATIALFIYHGFNLVAPASLTIPFPTALALLTGVASMVPLVVGKLVYVPLTVGLGAIAVQTDPTLLVYPIGLFVVCLALADLLPMGYLLPRIAGRKTHVGLVLFAYILGPILFGWYGLFLGPLLLVLGIQLVRIGFTELLHGEPLTPQVTAAGSIGSDPVEASSGSVTPNPEHSSTESGTAGSQDAANRDS